MTADPTTTLAAHRWRGAVDFGPHDGIDVYYVCTCGWRARSGRPAHDRHVLAVLAEEGWAIVKLPEPDPELGSWWGNNVLARSGFGRVRLYLDDSRIEVDDARELATALLAAARAAEAAS